MTKQRASRVRDGKRQARQMEEFHCAVLDIEEAMRHMSEDDRWIIINHLVLQTVTLDDLTRKYQLSGTSGARMRVQRAVTRLSRIMEHLYDYT